MRRGSYLNSHKFDGIAYPATASSCANCHTNLTTTIATLNSNGSIYNSTHRYNATTLASVKLIGTTGCDNCHNNTPGGYFNLISGAGTLLSNSTCVYCHPKLVDDWNLSLHSSQTDPVVNCVTCHGEHNATVRVSTTNTSCVDCHSPTTGRKHGTPGYNVTQCKYCHLPKVLTVNTTYDTASHTWNWTTQLLSSPGDERHEAVFDTLKNVTKNDTLTKQSCDMCHNYDFAGKVRTSYQASEHYNASANNVSANAVTPYCTDCHKTANTTEVINGTNTCNVGCHESLIHVNATEIDGVDCVNCHFNSSNLNSSHNLTVATVSNYTYTCSICHTPGTNRSIIPELDEWNNSGHNGSTHNSDSCVRCHSPMADTKGITCSICHNIHNMTEWLNDTRAEFGVEKSYGWYNASVVGKYTMVENTTVLCGNCHYNGRSGRTAPGWSSSTSTTPISPHYPSKDVFIGSPKDTGQYGIQFECGTCHIYKNTTYGNGTLNDSQKVTGHSFSVNAEGLQNTSNCNTCHRNVTQGDGSVRDYRMTTYIENIQNETLTKWNSTNTTVMNALATINASTAEKGLSRDKIAQAYWKLYLVKTDGSWGVHDRIEANQLLDDAVILANAANTSLGMGLTTNVDLVAGWNLVALNGTPAVTAPVSVLSSVSSNITVVWGYNATSTTWELYDPAMADVAQ